MLYPPPSPVNCLIDSKMAGAANASAGSAPFDIVATYKNLLKEDPDLTMPVAAIEALVLALAETPASTVSETLDQLQRLTNDLKASIANPIGLSAGTDLFQRYIITTLQRPSQINGAATVDFDSIRSHLVQNGRLFVERAKEARDKIAVLGKHFIRDGHTVLTNGGSRVVGALLRSAAETSGGFGSRGSIRFRVIYVVNSLADDALDTESADNISALRKLGVPVATIPPTAMAYALSQVTACFVGAEGVVENGGIISRLGTYQMGMLAKSAGKPFYVVAESHKFVRLYPLGQMDLGIEQDIVDFRTTEGRVEDKTGVAGGKGVTEAVNTVSQKNEKSAVNADPADAVDFTVSTALLVRENDTD